MNQQNLTSETTVVTHDANANAVRSMYGPIERDLRLVETIFDEEIASELPFVAELCEMVRSYRGKMLRPALVLLSAKACGGIRPDHHVVAGVVEMVHMATLVHDDILDEADERRKRPTIRRLAGNTGAVLLGDYLISHAFHLCASLDTTYACRRIGAVTNTVCEGELLQNREQGNTHLSEATYFEIIRRKTAVLTSVCTELGAWYAKVSPAIVQAMASFGMSAGIAFQIVDDILDIVGQQDQVGKSLGRDMAMGKMTLPMIHLLQSLPEDRASELRAAMQTTDSQPLQQIPPLLSQYGSIEYSLNAAKRFVDDALAQLQHLPPSDARSSLDMMARFILRREY